MSEAVSTQTISTTTARVRGIRWGLAAIVAAAAAAIYGAYGDPRHLASQEQDVPATIGVVAVIAVAVFGLLVPAGLRGMADRAGRWSGWALATGVLALVSMPITFWSGLPVVLGGAGALLGAAGRAAARAQGRSGALATSAAVLSWVAIAASLVLLVLGNTVLVD